MFTNYRKQYGCAERLQNMVLIDIRVFLESMSKKLSEYNLPNVSAHIDLQSRGYREVQEEYSINVEYEDLHARDYLNPDQKFAYDEIMRRVDQNIPGMVSVELERHFCTKLYWPISVPVVLLHLQPPRRMLRLTTCHEGEQLIHD
uniref:Uncharacterized protein n=1 Tax=Lactuca sativa TaxID=4236 RepID=A0A9R1WR03_LACSA|nr:hypothetical protein LSAT_V11C100019140 [Lactuca sativa]